jgi:hypothetical protein
MDLLAQGVAQPGSHAGAILSYARHLQFGPRPVVFASVATASAIGINASFDTGVPAGVGATTIDARTPVNHTSFSAKGFHLPVL